jgi:hypothetical protein
MLIDGAQDERGQGKIPGDFNFLSDQHVEGARENQLRFQVRLDQARPAAGNPLGARLVHRWKAGKAPDHRALADGRLLAYATVQRLARWASTKPVTVK